MPLAPPPDDITAFRTQIRKVCRHDSEKVGKGRDADSL